MTVVVLGGAGYIGSHTVDRLVEKGYDVAVIDNLITGRLILKRVFTKVIFATAPFWMKFLTKKLM